MERVGARKAGQPKVVIVGAGIAGIVAADTLIQGGFSDVKILEASNRAGGRIHTVDIDDVGKKIEMGANWIHGKKKNPVYYIAKEHDLIKKPGGDKKLACEKEFRTERGRLIDKSKVSKAKQKFSEIYDRTAEFFENNAYTDINESMGDYFDREFSHYTEEMNSADRTIAESVLQYEKHGECAYSGCGTVDEMSLKGYGSYEELSGKHCTFEHGYSSLVNILKQNIPQENILFGKTVKAVHWGNEGKDCKVRIECANGENYLADYVIVTVSLGVLKTASDMFIPKLPQRKLDAIDKLGFGVVDKVILSFDEPPMGKVGELGLLWDVDPVDQKENSIANWCRKIYEIYLLRNNTVIAWVSGKEAMEMESLPEDQVTHDMMAVMRAFLGHDGIPKPKKLIRTRWGSDPLTLGSYSFVKVGSSSEDIQALQKPVSFPGTERPCLLFAGEATHDSFYSTTHGALESGKREAKRIINLHKVSNERNQ